MCIRDSFHSYLSSLERKPKKNFQKRWVTLGNKYWKVGNNTVKIFSVICLMGIKDSLKMFVVCSRKTLNISFYGFYEHAFYFLCNNYSWWFHSKLIFNVDVTGCWGRSWAADRDVITTTPPSSTDSIAPVSYTHLDVYKRQDRLRGRGSLPATFYVLTRVFLMANINSRKFKQNQISFCIQPWFAEY